MLKPRRIDELEARQADPFAVCSRPGQISSETPSGDPAKVATFIRDYRVVSHGTEVETADLPDLACAHAGAVLDMPAPGAKR